MELVVHNAQANMNSIEDSSHTMAAGIVITMMAALAMKFMNTRNNTVPLIEEIQPPKKYTIRLKKVRFTTPSALPATPPALPTTPSALPTTPPAIIGSEDIIEYMMMCPVGVYAKDIAKDLKNIYPDLTSSQVNSLLYKMKNIRKVYKTEISGVAAPLWKLL